MPGISDQNLRHFLVPEESFLVQLKAASVRTVKYESEDAVNWLYQLEIPLFFGRVDLAKSSISLYPPHSLSLALLQAKPRRIHVHFDAKAPRNSSDDVRHVVMKSPALTWSLETVVDAGFMLKAYAVLKSHVLAHRRNFELRRIGTLEIIEWVAGEPVSGISSTMQSSGPSEVQRAIESMVAPLSNVFLDIVARKRYGDLPALLGFVAMLRNRGVDPDPGNTLSLIAFQSADGDEITDDDIIALRIIHFPGTLNLSGTKISDSAISKVPETVERLNLERTRITDHGLRAMKKLVRLKRLNLSQVAITDEGLKELKGLGQLEWLDLTGTRVTDRGVEDLQLALPSLVIRR